MHCREAAIYERKIRKARAKRNEDLARRLRARRPTYKLDHLVKERYTTSYVWASSGGKAVLKLYCCSASSLA